MVVVVVRFVEDDVDVFGHEPPGAEFAAPAADGEGLGAWRGHCGLRWW